MKCFIVTLAIVASAMSSFAGGCGSCGQSAPQCGPRCAPQCGKPSTACCAKKYYPGQTFCTGAASLNLFGGGCGNSCNPCR